MARYFIKYIGAKTRLISILAPMLESIPHSGYVEVFAGMASIFLNKHRAKVNILNDYDREIITLWRCVQRHPDELVRVINGFPPARDFFESIRGVDLNSLTDIERAARIIYLSTFSFSGKINAKGTANAASMRMETPPRNLLSERENVIARIKGISSVIQSVILENRDWSEILTYYDSPEMLFYLDPPYYKTSDYYSKSFGAEQYEKMRDQLRGLKGKWVLSLDDCPETRELFGEFDIEEKDFYYQLNSKSQKEKGDEKELIITRNKFLEDRLL